VQAMIGYNYYAAERVHPCAVLGMLYVLEVIASVYGGKAADSIARAIGRETGAGGFRFLSSHATMDADHMAKLNVLLKTIDDAEAQAAIIASTRVNFHQFGQLFSDGGFASHLAG
jgi:heme oxygenase